MKTAVEWYNAKLNAIDFKLNSGLINYEQCKVEMSEAFEQAKAMEKVHLYDFYMRGGYNAIFESDTNVEQYYNETFKSE